MIPIRLMLLFNKKFLLFLTGVKEISNMVKVKVKENNVAIFEESKIFSTNPRLELHSEIVSQL